MTDSLQYFDDFFLQGAKEIQDSFAYDDESRVAEISDSVTITGMEDNIQINARVMSATRGSICPSKYFTEDSCSCERQIMASTLGYLPDVTSASGPVSLANSNTMPTFVHTTPTGFEEEDENTRHSLPYDEFPNPISRDPTCDNEREIMLNDRTMETVNYSDDDSLWSLEVDVEKIFRMSRQGCVGLESREMSQATLAPTESTGFYPPISRTETKMRKEALKIAQLLCVKPSSESNKKKMGSACSDGEEIAINISLEQQMSNKIRNLRDTIEVELEKQGERTRQLKSDQKERHQKRVDSVRPTPSERKEKKGVSTERTVNLLKAEEACAKLTLQEIPMKIDSVQVKPKAQKITIERLKAKLEKRDVNEKIKPITTTAVLTTRTTRSQSAFTSSDRLDIKPKSKFSAFNNKSAPKAKRCVSESKAQEKRKATMKEKAKQVQNQRKSRETSRFKSPLKKMLKAKQTAKQQTQKLKPDGDMCDRHIVRPKLAKKPRNSLSRDKDKKTAPEKIKIPPKGRRKSSSSKARLSPSKQANVKKTDDKQKTNVPTLKKPLKSSAKPVTVKAQSVSRPEKHNNRPEAIKKTGEVVHKNAKPVSSPHKIAMNLKKSLTQTPARTNIRIAADGDAGKKDVKQRAAQANSTGVRKAAQVTAPLQRKTPSVKGPTFAAKAVKEPKPVPPPKKPPVPVFRKEKPVERPAKRPEAKIPVAKPVTLKPWLSGKTPRKDPHTPSTSTLRRPTPSARPKSIDEALRQKRQQATPKLADKRPTKTRSETRARLLPSKSPSMHRGRLSSRSRRSVAAKDRGDFSFSSDEYVVTPMFVTPFTLKECYDIIQKQPRHSYTREILTSEIVSLYNGQRTKLGCELVHCVAVNVRDPSESYPRIPDNLCIDKFQSFFYPLLFKLFRKTSSKIEEIFRQPELKTAVNAENHIEQSPLQLMPLRWATLPSNYLQKYRFLNNYVVSIDLEVRRNITGYRIGEAMRLEERHDVQIRLTKALFDFDECGVTSCLDSAQVADLRKNIKKCFQYYNLATDQLFNTPLGQSVYISFPRNLESSSHVTAWINVDDHLQLTTLNESFDRINIVLSTLNSCSTVVLENLISRTNKIRKITCEIRGDSATQTGNKFMTHPTFGYVTNNPKHLGTGCQLRFLVRIPLIGHLPDIDNFTSDFIDLKAVPFDSEHPDREVFYLFSECCFNVSEAAMITTSSERAAALLRVEKAMKKCNPRFPEEVTMPVEPLRYLYRKMNSAIFERPQGFQSVTWKCLNSGTVEQNISLFTSYGGSLAHCIRHNAYHPDETLPRACDPEAYTLFSEFFNRVLSETNQGEMQYTFCDLENTLKEDEIAALEYEHPRVLYFQVRFVRNVAGFAFSPIISATARRLVEIKLLSYLKSLKHDCLGSYYSLNDLTTDCEATLNALQKETKGEFHQDVFSINTNSTADKCVGCFRNWPTSRGVYFLTQRPLNTDTTIWINTTDHFKLVAVAKKFGHAYTICQRILHQLHQTSPDFFAKSDHKGYLTFCPNEVGNGMRLSARVSLPFLSKKMELFKQLCEKQQLDLQFVSTDNQLKTFDIHHTARIGKSSIRSAMLFLRNLKELLHLDHSFEMLETI